VWSGTNANSQKDLRRGGTGRKSGARPDRCLSLEHCEKGGLSDTMIVGRKNSSQKKKKVGGKLGLGEREGGNLMLVGESGCE